jgi:hypothetical protein
MTRRCGVNEAARMYADQGAPPVCELCGHTRDGTAPDHPTHARMRDAITSLADLADDHPIAVVVMLMRVCHPTATQGDIAQRLRRSRQAVTWAVARLVAARPDLAGALGVPGHRRNRRVSA